MRSGGEKIEGKAIEHFEEARRIALGSKLWTNSLSNWTKKLGIAQMRRAEDENCVETINAKELYLSHRRGGSTLTWSRI